jgi:tetratricopeptide (TPR) repeat protein
MADRYLYFILPGLLGGALLAAPEAAARIAARSAEPARALRRLRRAGCALGLVACTAVAARAHERAGIWRSSALLYADAAAHYPEGTVASLLRAKRAALAGDADAALPELQRAVSRGYNRFEQLEADAAWDGIREDPRFRALVREIAARWIETGRSRPWATQAELRTLAHAYVVRGEYAEALRSYDAALAAGGPDSAAIRAEIAVVQAALASGDPRVRVRLGAAAPD